MKKVMKISVSIGIVLVLAVAAFAIWNWDTISIMLGNKAINGPVDAIPDAELIEIPPLSMGNADWIGWRGARGDGRSDMKSLITDWSAGLKKKWSVEFLCRGDVSATWSAPVIMGNRLVVCGRDDTHDLVFCLDPDTGKLIWKGSYPVQAGSSYGTGPRATPWIDEDRVYTLGRSGDLVCWQLLDGEKRWHRNVGDEGGKEPGWGYATSPLVTETMVVVNGGGEARTIAYDKLSGKLIWKSGQGHAGYAALRAIQLEGEPAVLTFHGKGLAALDLKTGKILWDILWETSYDVNATTPLIIGDRVFITSGYGTGGQLLKVDRSGATVIWKNDAIASHHSDPIIIDGYIYGYSGDSMQNRGDFKCVELETGMEKWSTAEMGWGTSVYVAGYLLCSDIKGNLYLMKPDPERFNLITSLPKALGKIKGASWTVPVLANGNLYLRFKQRLLCYDVTAQ